MKYLVFIILSLLAFQCAKQDASARDIDDKVEQCVYTYTAIERVPVERIVKNPVFPAFTNSDFDLVAVPNLRYVKTGYGAPTAHEIRKAYKPTLPGAYLDTVIQITKIEGQCKLVPRPDDKLPEEQ